MGRSTMTSGLVSTWVTVSEPSGRTHLEARWVPAPSTTTAGTVPRAEVTHAA